MHGADFLIIGGGIAGLSAASRLVRHGRVVVLEAEDALGYHSSGRSASFSHFGIGDAVVRGLTAYSHGFFEEPPEGFSEVPLSRPEPALHFAREEGLPALDGLRAALASMTDRIEDLDVDGLARVCPVVRVGADAAVRGLLDSSCIKLDSDALMQSYGRTIRNGGGTILTGRRIAAISQSSAGWQVRTEAGEQFGAPILINAGGAWADQLAALAGVRPLGLEPKRRTIIIIDPPADVDPSALLFAHSTPRDFYMLYESGRLLVSAAGEVDDEPCDAQPDDYDIALAADRLEFHTTLSVTRIAHRWAGLRTFTADRIPTAGFAPDAAGFFWLAGQGGYGLQTGPAMADAAEALITGGPWPEGLARFGVLPVQIAPERLFDA